MGRRTDLNGYVERLLDGLAGRVAAQLSAPVAVVPDAGVGPPDAGAAGTAVRREPVPERVAVAAPEPPEEPPVPREPVLTGEERAALAVLGDPRIAADLRRADLEPDRFTRPYEEISSALGLR